MTATDREQIRANRRKFTVKQLQGIRKTISSYCEAIGVLRSKMQTNKNKILAKSFKVLARELEQEIKFLEDEEETLLKTLRSL